VATSATVEYYCRIVLEKATLRKLIEAGTTIATEAFTSKEDSGNVLDRAEQMIFGISDAKTRTGFVALGDILGHSFEVIQELYDKKKHVTGVESGFFELDTKTAGFQPSDLVVLASRPSMGKTSLSMNIAEHAAIKNRVPVAVFSLEMAREQVVLRMLCSQARVESHRVRTGYLRESDWPLLTTAAGLLSKAPIYIDDTPAMSVLEMRSKARRLKSEANIGLIIVDYLQLVRGSVGRGEQTAGDFADIPVAQGPGQGAQGPGGRALPAFQSRGDARRRQAAGAVGPEGVRGNRAGRGRRHIHLPAGSVREDPGQRGKGGAHNREAEERSDRHR
jgi:replicative DNA helicase